MKMNLTLYVISCIIGIITIYAGFTGKSIVFIKDARSAVIVLGIIGFLMCIFGAIGVFVTRAPAHPLTIAGFILGLLAVLTALIHIFRFKVPILNDPRSALTIMTIIIIIKIIIARFSFLLPYK